MNHFLLMLLFAAMISVFFGTLLRDETKESVRFALKMFLILSVASLAVAWLLFPFP